MDPIAHTLVGASLAATGLARRSRFGAAALVVGANLPDVDALTYALGADTSLLLRRGWTHGVVALIVLPLFLAAGLRLLERMTRSRNRGALPARWTPLMALAVISVWSHPALDLLNTYGVRLLMPLDDRWFYGDTLFIADPWFWLLAGAGAVAACGRGWLLSAGWIALGALGTAFVFLGSQSSRTSVAVWIAAVSVLAAVRTQPRFQRQAPTVAVAGLAGLLVYITAMRAGSVAAREQARAWLADRQITPVTLMAGPVPVDPWRRDVVVGLPDRYEFLMVNLWTGHVGPGDPPLPRGDGHPAVDAALATVNARGFRAWKRFPSYTVTAEPGGHRVLMRDVRYAREGDRGFAVAEVWVPAR